MIPRKLAALCLACLAWLGSLACSRQPDPGNAPAAGQQADAPGPAAPARPQDVQAPDASVPADPIPPTPPAELPPDDPNAKMHAHMDRIFGLLGAHLNDCERAEAEVRAYVTAQRAEFLVLQAESEARQQAMDEKELKAYRAVLIQRGQQMFQSQMKTMLAFHRQCPKQMTEINQIIGSLTQN